MEVEKFLSGYCRQLDAARTVCAVVEDGEITEDELKKMLDDIQKTTDRYIASLDAALAGKEKELMTV